MTGLYLLRIPVAATEDGETKLYEYGQADFLDPTQEGRNERNELRFVYIGEATQPD